MKLGRLFVGGVVCLSLLVLAATPAEAQMNSGTVMGKVTTPEGEPAVGAKVTIKSQSTARKCVVKTDKHGEYICAGLRQGNYEITVEYEGIKVSTRDVPVVVGLYGNPASSNFRNRFDIPLGQVVQQQEVSAEQQEAEQAAGGFEHARALNQAGKYQEAADELLAVIEHDPSQWIAYAELAIAYEGLGRTEDAMNAYLTAIDLNPTEPGLYNNLGKLYMNQGRVEEAREQFEIAAELSGESGDTFYYNLAVTFYNSGDMKAAIEPLQQVLEFKPDHANAHFFLGVCLYSTAETKQEGGEIKTILPPGTRQHFERYLELAPSGQFAENARQYLQIIEESVPAAVRVKK
ncbi:tetratricopeptide repeat protein [Acidobacteriia bacterium AH_259_A11_L15]|nr:tetratricopeptide repeat protein [Acidobacteriia bacterium AH_259_A11_L15]